MRLMMLTLRFSFVHLRGDARCTIHCIPALGKIPQLQCKVCLCLYHHECAKKSIADLADKGFTCEVTSKTFASSSVVRVLIFLSASFRIAISNSQNRRKSLRQRKSINSRHRQPTLSTISKKALKRLSRLMEKSLLFFKRTRATEFQRKFQAERKRPSTFSI